MQMQKRAPPGRAEIRRNCLNIYGIFGFTPARSIHGFHPPDQTRQFEQLLNAERRAARGHDIKRVLGHRTGPLGR